MPAAIRRRAPACSSRTARSGGDRLRLVGKKLKVDARIAPAGAVRELASLVNDFPGETPVYADPVTSMGSKLLELGPKYRVKPGPDFLAEVKVLLSEAAVA